MSIDLAVLRQRSTQLLARLQFWPDPADQPPADKPPSVAPMLFKLAYIAVGDADSALALITDVFAHLPREQVVADHIDEVTALHTLVARLPQGWLSWPGAAGPSEWLRLHLRREQADRLLSVLGERDPIERIALALHLLYDVRRDDLDAWLGTRGMGDQISEFVGYVGEGLELMPLPIARPECAAIAHDLLDLHEPQLGRVARLHTIGCRVCAARANGLHETLNLLAEALRVFFRAAMPNDVPLAIMERRREIVIERVRRWRPAGIALLIVTLYLVWPRTDAVADSNRAARAAAPLSAAQVLERALDRFRAPQTTGVLHEKVRFANNGAMATVERWYDLDYDRVRLTVSTPQSAAPLLDLATDGSTLTYAYNGPGRSRSVQVKNAEVQKLLPLLRQLPFTGNLSDSPIDQRNLDLPLLAEARRSRTMLLGTTQWQGRPAYVLSSTTVTRRTLLTIDQATWSLLEARAGDDNSPMQVLWRADVFEVVPRRTVPAATFVIAEHDTVATQIDPRQFAYRPLALIDLNSATTISPLPIPQQLPEPAALAYVRLQGRTGNNVVQMYEGQWSTMGIVAPRTPPPAAPPLDRTFARGQYRVIAHDLPQVTIVEFAMNDLPQTRMSLYLWHALASDTEREAMVVATLDSLKLVDSTAASAYSDIFVQPAVAPGPSWYIRSLAAQRRQSPEVNPASNMQPSRVLR